MNPRKLAILIQGLMLTIFCLCPQASDADAHEGSNKYKIYVDAQGNNLVFEHECQGDGDQSKEGLTLEECQDWCNNPASLFPHHTGADNACNFIDLATKEARGESNCELNEVGPPADQRDLSR